MISTQTSFLLVSCFYYFEVLGKQTQGLHTKPSITELQTLEQQQKQELNSKHHSDPPKFYPFFFTDNKISFITDDPQLHKSFENNRGERHKIMVVTLKTKSYY